MKPTSSERVPRPPGQRLRHIAQKVCSPSTLEHVVDPIVADMQHEWDHALQRSCVARAWVRLAGYVTFGKALALHTVLAVGGHLARNAFGVTGQERAFHRRAGAGTLGALAASTSIVALYGMVTMIRSLVYLFTHLRWPGPPTVADVLPAAVEIATNPRGLLLLLPGLVAATLPPSLLFGILRGVRPTGTTRPTPLRPLLRSVAGVSLAATLSMLALTGWVVPALGQRYREFVTASISASISSMPVSPGYPAKELRELSLPELEAGVQAADLAGQSDSSRSYRVEWHRRLAWAAASLAFGLVGLGLAAQRRVWTTRRVRAVGVIAFVLHYWGLAYVSARALDLAPSSPFLAVWSMDAAVALVAAVLIVRAYRHAKSSLVAA